MRNKPTKKEPAEKSLPAAFIFQKEPINAPSEAHKKSDNIQRTINRVYQKKRLTYLIL